MNAHYIFPLLLPRMHKENDTIKPLYTDMFVCACVGACLYLYILNMSIKLYKYLPDAYRQRKKIAADLILTTAMNR